ncbi:Regulation of enolase protein 1 [Mesorhizobium sp. ORS 3324]|nr:Regulation of enolase protein 1 [Mesorhizobium sp. ORS 3324]
MSAFAGMAWLNPPPHHAFGDGTLHVRTGKETDFWRETFYGFRRDNGHFLYRPIAGDFSAEVTVRGEYKVLYDQAGLMLRLNETHWIKAGIEYTDGLAYFSVVVTNDTSDWSLVGICADPNGVRIRLTRHAEAIRVQYLDAADGHWKPVRLAYFPVSRSVDVGMMCCSPQREGFEVTFSDFAIGPPIARELHD